MALNLTLLYRGPLSSCNYGCEYCPFAKRQESAEELAHDRRCLDRFVGWIADRRDDTIGILFTPWGEALVRRWYQEALPRLSHMPQVAKVAIQTNLSCRLDWIEACDRTRLALWTTFHPTEVRRADFVARCLDLRRRGVRFSVGAVGLKENFAEIEALRRELPDDIYVWINAYKREPEYYLAQDVRRLESIDPLFALNTVHHPSRGRACRGGESVLAVDGDGTLRRCHFIREPIGNLYEPDFERALTARPCSNDTCGCHIGYVHMPELRLYETFDGGILERIPKQSVWRRPHAQL